MKEKSQWEKELEFLSKKSAKLTKRTAGTESQINHLGA